MNELPKYQNLVIPMLRVLSDGRVLHNKQISSLLSKQLAIPAPLLEAIHSGTRTEFDYRLAWTRTKAKNSGWIQSDKREHWSITSLGKTQV